VIVLTFAEYAIQPFHRLLGLDEMTKADNDRILKIISLLALGKVFHISFKITCSHQLFVITGIITYINMTSVKLYVKINNIFGFFKVIACVVVIIGGIYELAKGNTENLSSGFDNTTTNPGFIAL
jgi:solute carrier family 7 (L-type amino acid transporter), member 9/15